MQMKKAIELLSMIRDGHDTISDLILYTGNHSIGYLLNQAQEFGFLEQYKEGRKKPYKLTEKGEKFLKLML
jgi:predicted transcriptional regulator